MAGNYPDPISHRIAYERDGTVGLIVNDDNSVSQVANSVLVNMNDENFNNAVTFWRRFALIFPEPMNIKAAWATSQLNFSNQAREIMVSPNTTNGVDGTWTTTWANGSGWHQGADKVLVRSPKTPSPAADNIVGMRFQFFQQGYENIDLKTIHIYGEPVNSTDRLTIWHPSSDLKATAGYFDWGNVPRNSSQDKVFRIKNTDDIYTANDINVTLSAPTDTTPSVMGQHLLQKESAPGFAASINIPSLAPGQISEVLTLRRVTPTNAVMSLWTLRMIAHANSWT